MSLIFIGASIYLVAKLIGNYDTPNIQPKVDDFYIYSGIHPQLYKEYLNYKKDGKIKEALYSLEELALYADLEFRDEIYEKILKQESLFI